MEFNTSDDRLGNHISSRKCVDWIVCVMLFQYDDPILSVTVYHSIHIDCEASPMNVEEDEK